MNRGIPFVHKRVRRSRSVKIHVTTAGTVIVTTPWYFPTADIPKHIEQARDWIEKQLARQREKPQLISDSHAYFFGERHELIVTDRMDGSVEALEGKLLLSPVGNNHLELLEKWLRNRAIEYCLDRLAVLSSQMSVEFNGVRFKQQRTCWGSCSSDKNLNFNWRLVHAPPEVIDYVLIHELAHTVHLNHGRQFWDLVAKHDPDHPLHRGWLKRYGSTE